MSTAILTERTAVLYQTMPPLSTGFARLTEAEEREVRELFAPGDVLADYAVGNAQWRKAHPGWRSAAKRDKRSIYFISDEDGFIKIGSAGNVKSRLKNLQTAHRQRLRVVASMPGTTADEKALHARFSDAHIRGEWFTLSPELAAFIQEVQS